jgi:hypothetical protein
MILGVQVISSEALHFLARGTSADSSLGDHTVGALQQFGQLAVVAGESLFRP